MRTQIEIINDEPIEYIILEPTNDVERGLMSCWEKAKLEVFVNVGGNITIRVAKEKKKKRTL